MVHYVAFYLRVVWSLVAEELSAVYGSILLGEWFIDLVAGICIEMKMVDEGP